MGTAVIRIWPPLSPPPPPPPPPQRVAKECSERESRSAIVSSTSYRNRGAAVVCEAAPDPADVCISHGEDGSTVLECYPIAFRSTTIYVRRLRCEVSMDARVLHITHAQLAVSWLASHFYVSRSGRPGGAAAGLLRARAPLRSDRARPGGIHGWIQV